MLTSSFLSQASEASASSSLSFSASQIGVSGSIHIPDMMLGVIISQIKVMRACLGPPAKPGQ